VYILLVCNDASLFSCDGYSLQKGLKYSGSSNKQGKVVEVEAWKYPKGIKWKEKRVISKHVD